MGREEVAPVSGKCCRRVKKGIEEERGRMKEKEGGGERLFFLNWKEGRKEDLRCGGDFFSWHSALTDACCSALVRCLLSCHLDYYQGLAAGYN